MSVNQEEVTEECNPNLNSPKPLAFTIDFGNGKVDEGKHKSLMEKYKKRHRRLGSTGKLKSDLSESDTATNSTEPKEFVSLGASKKQPKTQSATSSQSQSPQHSSSQNEESISLSSHSELPLQVENSFIDNKYLVGEELRSSESKTDPSELEEFDTEEVDTVSDAGTYTLDGDNYTEEQKARMSIDKVFKIEQITVEQKIEDYFKSNISEAPNFYTEENSVPTQPFHQKLLKDNKNILYRNASKEKDDESITSFVESHTSKTDKYTKTSNQSMEQKNINAHLTSLSKSKPNAKKIIKSTKQICDNVIQQKDTSQMQYDISKISSGHPTEAFIHSSPIHSSDILQSYPKTSPVHSNITSKSTHPLPSHFTYPLHSPNTENQTSNHVNNSNQGYTSFKNSNKSVNEPEPIDQGSFISVTSSGVFRKQTELKTHRRVLSLTKSEIHVETYSDNKLVLSDSCNNLAQNNFTNTKNNNAQIVQSNVPRSNQNIPMSYSDECNRQSHKYQGMASEFQKLSSEFQGIKSELAGMDIQYQGLTAQHQGVIMQHHGINPQPQRNMPQQENFPSQGITTNQEMNLHQGINQQVNKPHIINAHQVINQQLINQQLINQHKVINPQVIDPQVINQYQLMNQHLEMNSRHASNLQYEGKIPQYQGNSQLASDYQRKKHIPNSPIFERNLTTSPVRQYGNQTYSSENADLSDNSLDTESYLEPTQSYINSLQQMLLLNKEKNHENHSLVLNNDKQLPLKKLTHMRHNSFDDRHLKFNKLEHFKNKNLLIDQTKNVFDQSKHSGDHSKHSLDSIHDNSKHGVEQSRHVFDQSKNVFNQYQNNLKGSPNSSPIKRSSSFSKSQNNSRYNEFNSSKVYGTKIQLNQKLSPSIQRSSSSNTINPNALKFGRLNLSDFAPNRSQFETDSSSDEEVPVQKEKLNRRYNRTFSLRRAQHEESRQKCPNTPEMKRKFQPPEKTERAVSVDRKVVKGNEVQSRYLQSINKTKSTKTEVTPVRKTSSAKSDSQPLVRRDSGQMIRKVSSAPKPTQKPKSGKLFFVIDI